MRHKKPSRIFIDWLLPAAAMLAAGTAAAADVNSPIAIPLQAFPYSDPATGMAAFKYGIMASLGGAATPQLFEFDTGSNSGFYAAYSNSAAWWGQNVTNTGPAFTMGYASGNSYAGNTVNTSVSLFGLNGGAPLFTTAGADYAVGQTTSITTSQGNWPGSGPPVDGHFYGDFGAGVVLGANNISALFGQLTYGTGVTAGFIVATGPYGATNGAYVQIGLGAADIANANTTWFTMQPAAPATAPFPHSGLPSYNAAAMRGSLTLNGQTPTGLQNVPLILDTGGTSTTLYYDASDAALAAFVAAFNLDPQSLALSAISIGQQVVPVFSYAINDALSNTAVHTTADTHTAVNTGATLFQTYAVTFDLQNGLVGLTPYDVPEPSALLGLLTGLVVLASVARGRPVLALSRRIA